MRSESTIQQEIEEEIKLSSTRLYRWVSHDIYETSLEGNPFSPTYYVRIDENLLED